jgi:hypothetical protein
MSSRKTLTFCTGHSAENLVVFVRAALALQRDVGTGAQHGDRRLELMRGVAHESAHLRDGGFDRLDGLLGEGRAADADQ